VLTASEFDARVAARAADAERQRRLEAATVVFVQPGNTAAEQTYSFKSEPAERAIARMIDRSGRGGPGWFSYDVPVEAGTETAIVVTYHNDLGLPVLGSFDILVDGTAIGHYAPNRTATGFWSETYALPASLVSAKTKVTLRFQAAAEGRIAPVYGIRVVRVKSL